MMYSSNTVYDQCMPGVMAALKAHYCAGTLRKEIDNFTFAFVTPLSADDNNIISHRIPAS